MTTTLPKTLYGMTQPDDLRTPPRERLYATLEMFPGDRLCEESEILTKSLFVGMAFNDNHHLTDGDFTRSWFVHCVFTGADLSTSIFLGCVFMECDFTGATIGESTFSEATFIQCNFERAEVMECEFDYVTVKRCRFRGSMWRGTKLPQRFVSIGPIGSRNDTLYAWQEEGVLMVEAGCYTGPIDNFKDRVEERHGDSDHGTSYDLAIELIQHLNFCTDLWPTGN